jgi:hypothetical protein
MGRSRAIEIEMAGTSPAMTILRMQNRDLPYCQAE